MELIIGDLTLLDSVEILSHRIPIRHDPQYRAQNMAQFDASIMEMKVAKELPLSVKREAILHEIVEAINIMCELGLEHRQITALSEMLAGVKGDKLLRYSDMPGIGMPNEPAAGV
jgi:hypothetical protein